jgi:predicted HAD superfamily phosphohydrolase YqeG
LKEYELSSDQVAVIGDQLLTDICGGKRMRIYTVLTSPLYTKDIIYTKITRIVENMIYFVFEKQGKLIKGEYYGEIL